MGGRGGVATLLLAVTAAASVLGCGSQKASVESEPRPSASAVTASNDAGDRCATLKARASGIESCPPASLAMDRPRVSHDASMSDEEAQKMAQGAVRTQALDSWAVNHGYDRFLQAGLLSYPEPEVVRQSFGADLDQIAAARKEGKVYRLDPPLRLDTVRAVSVPPDGRQQASQLRMVSGATGLVLRLVGPYAEYIGDRQVRAHPADFAASILVYGELRNDPDLGGWIWYWGGYAQCIVPLARRICDA